MRQLLIVVFLVVGLLLVLFHGRVVEFQMAMYQRWLPFGGSSTILRVFYKALIILIGAGFIAAAAGYFVGALR